MRHLLVLALGCGLLGTGVSSPVLHFRPLKKSQLPESFFQYLCREKEGRAEKLACIQDFNRHGSVWAGDVNDDGVDEFIVDAGDSPGTEGPSREIIQLRGKDWFSLACLDSDHGCDRLWNSLHARFDILPIIHDGYRDIRIAVDRCLKWDGRHYADYDDSDYHRLKEAWFDVEDNREAELFWKIRYSGVNVIQFQPFWFPVSQEEFGHFRDQFRGTAKRADELPKVTSESLRDPDYDINWVSFRMAGVWGVRGNRAFLLVPRPSYTGARCLELNGDWLYIYSGIKEDTGTRPDITYNRRTGELRYQQHGDQQIH